MSVDPYMRGRMNAGKSYVPPFQLGIRSTAAQSAMSSSRAPRIQAGRCRHLQLWLAGILRRNARGLASGQPRHSAALGIPWHPRHDGHDRVGRAESGRGQSRRRHLHFGAAGAVGQCGRATGEIARVPCHRIGRSAEKLRFLTEECDSMPLQLQIRSGARTTESEAPEGIDVYFDNVAAKRSKRRYRRCVCTAGSSPVAHLATTRKAAPGPSNLFK